MRVLIVIFMFTLSLCSSAQTNAGVKLKLSSETVKLGEGMKFTVTVGSDVQLEVAVFSDTQAVFVNKALLSSGDNVFDVPAKELHPGKYYVLLTADGLHEQQSFLVKE